MTDDNIRPERSPRSRRTLAILGAIALLGAIGFGALGVWQVERLGWKNALIAAVAERAHSVPLELNTADWSGIDAEAIQYQRVLVNGSLLPIDVLTQAVTDEGAGFWVITPLRLPDGRTVLVNRGFAPKGAAVDLDTETPATIKGLIRVSEPEGGFLRDNDPIANRWFSRDVVAIGTALGMQNLAPFFIDADNVGEGYPIGGLTVVSFSNNHLIYALTWFALAAMLLAGFGYVVWDRKRG